MKNKGKIVYYHVNHENLMKITVQTMVIYYFYTRDHLGNNRVVRGEVKKRGQLPGGGSEFYVEVVQRTDYYPSGLPFPNMLNPDIQPYKYGGKEFDTMHGLNQYDYGARMYDPQLMRWHVPDPLAEKYPSISPYA
jgi:RHS repeat-associated protein